MGRMKHAGPSLLSFFRRSSGALRARSNAWECVAPAAARGREQQTALISATEMRSVNYDGVSQAGCLHPIVPAFRVSKRTASAYTVTDILSVTSRAIGGRRKASVGHALRVACFAYSTSGVVKDPADANGVGNRQHQGQPLKTAQSPTSDVQNAAAPHSYGLKTDLQLHERSTASSGSHAQQQLIDRTPFSAGHLDWRASSPVQPPSRESLNSAQPPQGHGYQQYDVRPSSHLSSACGATYEHYEAPNAAVSGYPYPVSTEGYAPAYNAQWGGVPNTQGSTNNGSLQPSPPNYMNPGGTDNEALSTNNGSFQPSPPNYMNPRSTDNVPFQPHTFGGLPPHFGSMPPPQQQMHPQGYPVTYGYPGFNPSNSPAVNSVTPPPLYSPMPGIPPNNSNPTGPVPSRSAGETHYYPASLDSSGMSPNAPEALLGARSRGHLSGGGSGEERLEQLLVEIRQRLGNRANVYDAALEQDPRALLELACRPESLRRMQHSSLDWWYVLFRWQDRYHAMQLSGEIRRRNAAAAVAASSSYHAAPAGSSSPSRGPEIQELRGRGPEKGGWFSFFSPEDEKAFFTFLQRLQEAFAARPLSEEAQAHGRLHDRMRCIRQLARAVSDDHRALGMGAAARKQADSLLWSLALQEARCAANSIDILRTKGGMPMLLSILRLAETADRRRRRSATRVLVPLSSSAHEEVKNNASTSQERKHTLEDDVVVQDFPGGCRLKRVQIPAEETQDVFDKLADAFLSCAQEANIEPCVHAVVGMGILAEKSFLDEGKWQKVCQAMTERLKLSEMVSAGSEAGLLLDSLTWMFVRNANASRRCRHVIFQVNSLLGQILRERRQEREKEVSAVLNSRPLRWWRPAHAIVSSISREIVGAHIVSTEYWCRCADAKSRAFAGEENLLFYTTVLLKRQLRSDEPRKTLTPRAFCNLLVANAIAGIPAKQHLGVAVKYLLNTMATHDRAKNLSLEESARLAWAICALQLYDPAVAGSQWPAKEAAELLDRLLSRVGRLIDGPQAAYILEALRDGHDFVAPLYPDMGFTEKYADQELREKACSAYDQSNLGLGGSIITVVRGALKSFGGTVKPGPERRRLLQKMRTGTSDEPDTATEGGAERANEPPEMQGTVTAPGAERAANVVSSGSAAGDDGRASTATFAETEEGPDTITKGFTKDRAEDAAEKERDTPVKESDEADRGALTEEGTQNFPVTPSGASRINSIPPSTNDAVTAEHLEDAEWIEGAHLDGYPVAFYSPKLKVALDVDVCSKLPSKYMKRRHMDRHLRENGISYLVFCADLKRPQEPLYSFLKRTLTDETGTLGVVGLHPTKVRAYLRTDRGSRLARTDDAE